MTLLQMNYLVEIYRCGSMNKAAQNLFVSQSAVSAAIRELEEELGIRIFHRSNRGIALTEDGRELLAQVAPLVERSRKIQNYYSERRVENRARLAISTQRYPFCAKAFVEFLHLLDEPRIEVSLEETDMSSVIEDKGPQLVAKSDSTCSTPLEMFLRDHHLDELPQLWNVLKGDMSLVGPRPERRYFIDKIMEHDASYPLVFEMRPGLTSEATLYNGYTDTMEKMLTRLHMDIAYLKKRTLWTDVTIIFKTFASIVSGRKF